MKPRVLIVDDNDLYRRCLNRALTREGAEVHESRCAAEALVEAHVGRYDAVLTDIDMPGGTGFDLADKLRERGLEMPLVFMSGDAKTDDRQARARAHAASLLDKSNWQAIVKEVLACVAVAQAEGSW